MLGKLILTVTPFVLTAGRIIATDPALRNFVLNAFGGTVPSTSSPTPVRPHAHAQAFGDCPECRGTGLVPIYRAPTDANGETDWSYYAKKYAPTDPPASH